MCYVYMLKCAGGSLYTGYTTDLSRRMAAHLSGKGGSFTRSHPPKQLAGVWYCHSAAAARRLEYAIKHRLSRSGKEALLQHPERVRELFPHLAAYDYEPHFSITLEDCLNG